MSDLPFESILFVCTGNICRSPTADGLMRHMLAEAGLGGRIDVDSCGTSNWHVGDAPTPMAVEKARRRGYDMSMLRARQLSPVDFQRFDLILAMDHGHLRQLRRAAPKGCKARIALFLDADADAGREEVPDPYYGGSEDYDYALDLIERGCRAWLAELSGGGR